MTSTGQPNCRTAPGRSRTVRKVKCGVDSSESSNRKKESLNCSNCQRLGFDCRWSPPAPGEQYVPPPKRRRTATQRIETSEETNGPLPSDPPGRPSTVEEDDQSSALSEMASTAGSYAMSSLTDHSTEALAQLSDLQLDFFGNLSPGFDFNLISNPSDLNLAGEGLDFIPLPVIDPSVLHSSTELVQTPALTLQMAAGTFESISKDAEHELPTAAMDEADNFVSPTLDSTSQYLIQHYLEVMKGYSKVDDRPKNENNLFISAFSESLCFPPLLYAILAFSASHLSIQDPSYTMQAENFGSLAATSFDSFRQYHTMEGTQIEGLLSALFVRVKRVHVMAENMDSFLNLMSIATDIISTEAGEKVLQNPSTLARRILLRLAILDSRTGCYRLGGGKLVSRLRQIPSFSFLFDFSGPLNTSLGDVVHLLRADILRLRIGELDTRMHEQQQVGMDEVTDLHHDIEREISRWELYSANRGGGPSSTLFKAEVLDSPTYGCYAVLSALHSAMLYLHTVFVRTPIQFASTIH
ncbi:C6 zinc finger domain-containing protein [Fusarium austroafricanum]|uniref:C6 zinc finger domain-containing protein n=1 Tax=Fusarium austroafricanum TaxID=2364996 RepID=A0A8H4JRS1_9HYPO|nr:C6 zinc finger domain-containing protein [Fusarium austroafricanum]